MFEFWSTSPISPSLYVYIWNEGLDYFAFVHLLLLFLDMMGDSEEDLTVVKEKQQS